MSDHLFYQGFALVKRWVQPNLTAYLDTRQPIILLLSVVIGLGASIAIIAFRLSVQFIQFSWSGVFSERMTGALQEMPVWLIVAAPAFGGLLVGLLLEHFIAGKRARGIADVMEARAAGKGLELRPGLGAALVSALSLGFGASAGREGPAVHLGGTIAASLCRTFALPRAAKRTLIACGAAAAIAASFNTPIAGVLFAHEVILGHYALRAFVPIVIASVTGAVLSRLYFGDFAAFIVPAHQITSYWEVPAFALLGITCALVAILFQFALIFADWLARLIDIPLWIRPVIGGVLVGGIGVFFPHVLGVGYEATDLALHNELPLLLMLILIVAKTLATAVTLASRFGGGIVSPSLFVGAMTGGAFGLIAATVFPHLASGEGVYAIIGMAAVGASVIGAPLSTAVMAFELTGGYAITMAILLAVSISWGMTQAIHGRGFFHWQLESRGLFLQEGPHRHMVRTITVADFMQPLSETDDVPALPDKGDKDDKEDGARYVLPDDTLGTALRVFDSSGATRLWVVDPADRTRAIAFVLHVRALRYFNSALIEAEIEEHR